MGLGWTRVVLLSLIVDAFAITALAPSRSRVGEAVGHDDRAVQELLEAAVSYVKLGRFHEARLRMDEACSLRPEDPELRDKTLRLERLAASFPKLGPPHTDAFDAAVIGAGLSYFYGRFEEALDKFRYAAMLKPEDDRPLPFLRELAREPAQTAADPCESEPSRAEDTARACEEALVKDPKSVRAFLRLGIARCRQRRWDDAESALRAALAYETEPDVRKAIALDLEAVRRAASLRRPAPAPRKTSKRLPKLKFKPDADSVQKWYELGIEAYSKGDLDRAAALFRKVLKAEPSHGAARKALERIEAERKAGQP